MLQALLYMLQKALVPARGSVN